MSAYSNWESQHRVAYKVAATSATISHGEFVTHFNATNQEVTKMIFGGVAAVGVAVRHAVHDPVTNLGNPNVSYIAGSQIAVATEGVVEVLLSNAVTQGAYVTNDGIGRGTTGSVTNHHGVALKAGVAGEYIPVRLK